MNEFHVYGNHLLHFHYVEFQGIELASSTTQWLEHPTGLLEFVGSIPTCNGLMKLFSCSFT